MNKVNSKAILRWNIQATTAISEEAKARFLVLFRSRVSQSGDLIIVSDKFRDQGRNTMDCLEKLKHMILKALHAPKERHKTKPTHGSVKRRLHSKRKTSEKKKDRRQKHHPHGES